MGWTSWIKLGKEVWKECSRLYNWHTSRSFQWFGHRGKAFARMDSRVYMLVPLTDSY